MVARASLVAGLLGMGLLTMPALAQFDPALTPAYSIWDVKLGEPVSQIPAMEVVEIACGTNGGPPSTKLPGGFADFAKCPAEPSGLHEVYFENDDEIDYLAKAQEAEYKVLQGGTSIYAHPVIVSVLVDGDAIVRGIRIVTDERVSTRERRVAVTLARNLKGRYGSWQQTCENLPPQPGRKPHGQPVRARNLHRPECGTQPVDAARIQLPAQEGAGRDQYRDAKDQCRLFPEPDAARSGRAAL